eukprot:s1283_g21.t1
MEMEKQRMEMFMNYEDEDEEEYDEEYKEQFRKMTDEEIERHIGLERALRTSSWTGRRQLHEPFGVPEGLGSGRPGGARCELDPGCRADPDPGSQKAGKPWKSKSRAAPPPKGHVANVPPVPPPSVPPSIAVARPLRKRGEGPSDPELKAFENHWALSENSRKYLKGLPGFVQQEVIHNFRPGTTVGLEPNGRVCGCLLPSSAKKECRIKQSQNCLPLLQDLRKRMWPYVVGELAETDANLDLTPNKILQDHVAKPDIYRAVLKPKLCNGKEKPIYFVDLTETNNKGLLKDLYKVSRGHLKLRPRDAKVNNCKRLVSKGEPRQRQNTFVLIRDPLERFISGYAAIERDLIENDLAGAPIEEYQFLSEGKNNLTKRATLFLHRFFKDSANYSSHVSSMAEYVGSVSNTCRELPKQWFAKVENVTKTWTMFLKNKGCKKALNSFSAFNTTKKGGRFEETLNQVVLDKEAPFTPSDAKIFGENDDGPEGRRFRNRSKHSKNVTKSLLQMERSNAMVMSELMGLNNYVYLRAFCWLSLPDYVIFDYGLPKPCHREDMDVIMKLTKQKVEDDPVMNPGKKNQKNKKKQRKQGQTWSKVLPDDFDDENRETGNNAIIFLRVINSVSGFRRIMWRTLNLMGYKDVKIVKTAGAAWKTTSSHVLSTRMITC